MSAPTKTKPLRIFISYTHSDEKLKDELRAHLSSQRRAGLIADWHDRRIGAGQEWKNAIDENLERAHIILLLISARFLNSAYCMDIEMKRALERHDEGKARVIPIILRPCDWQSTQFGRLQALPTDGRAVLKWRSHDEAWTVVAKEIGEAVRLFRSSTPAARRKQNRQTPVQTPPMVTIDGATKRPRSSATGRSTPPTVDQAAHVKVQRTRSSRPTTTPPALTTPVDSAPLLQRARSLVVTERGNYSGDGKLQVIVVGGPLQQVLRPSQIEDPALARELEQKAIYGTGAILTRGDKVTARIERGTLLIEQSGASLSLTEDGALAIVQTARRRPDSGHMGISALIEEDVFDSITRALRFAGIVLNRIDRKKQLKTLAIVVALIGSGYTPWRTRAEHAASPNSGTFGRGVDDVIVDLGRTIPRAALPLQIAAASTDLMTLVRRQVKG